MPPRALPGPAGLAGRGGAGHGPHGGAEGLGGDAAEPAGVAGEGLGGRPAAVTMVNPEPLTHSCGVLGGSLQKKRRGPRRGGTPLGEKGGFLACLGVPISPGLLRCGARRRTWRRRSLVCNLRQRRSQLRSGRRKARARTKASSGSRLATSLQKVSSSERPRWRERV